MAKYPHVFLKNDPSKKEGFKKTRGWEPKKTQPEEEKNYTPQKDRLREAHRIFNVQQRLRHNKRTIEVPEHIDQIQIHFFKVFNKDLRNKFLTQYGLQVLSFSDFNKTVWFAIDDENNFKNFVDHLKKYYESPVEQSYEGSEYHLIALVSHFIFITTKKIVNSYDEEVTMINLIDNYSPKTQKIYDSVIKFLNDKKCDYKYYENGNSIEAKKISKDDIELLADNFDVVQSIQTTRAGKVRPGQLGNLIRNFGVEMVYNEKAPMVGIIDTGVQPLAPLLPALTNLTYDLTNTAAKFDSNGHGTMVAGLVTLGTEFFEDPKEKYLAKANIVPIKVLIDSDGNFSQNELIKVIEDAYNNGVRLFNLSVNQFQKRYNSSFSHYAFLLDSLTYQYDLLIFISTGNINEARVEELVNTPHASHSYPNHFYCLETDSPFHRCETTNLCVPSESMNNISVGALADNFETGVNLGVTPAREYPAFYTRKFHVDYDQEINGTSFARNQKNKNLIKPDLVFPGGDLLDFDAGLEVLSLTAGQPLTRNAGTSFSTPLLLSLAAEVLTNYPSLSTQSVKALLINSASSPCGANPPGFTEKGLLKKLIGNGQPNRDLVLFSSENSATFILEDNIKAEEFKEIKIKLPDYLNPNKSGSEHKLNITATLCYKFNPIKNNHLSYCPLHISFGFFKPDVEKMNDKEGKEYQIKSAISWSEDHFGIENRLFSNVQKLDRNLQAYDIANVNNEICLAVRCTHKDEIDPKMAEELSKGSHSFSIVITFTELPHDKKNTNKLYGEITQINTVKLVGEIETDIETDIDIGEK